MNAPLISRRRPVAVVIAALALLGAAACSSGSDNTGTGPNSDQLATDINGPTDSGGSIPAGAAQVRFAPVEAADAPTLDKAAVAIRDRVRALGLKGVVVEVRYGSVLASVPKSVGAAQVKALADPHALAFRPVLQEFPGTANDDTTDPTCSSASAVPTKPCLAASDRDPGTTLLLGAAPVDGTVVDAVTPTAGTDGKWVVAIKAVESQRPNLNKVLNQCAVGASCPATPAPRGRLAMVLDGAVISSPTVTSDTVSDVDLQIAGLTKDKAETLANELRLASKPLPVALRPA